MRIVRGRFRHFRTLGDLSVEFGPLSVLVGSNSCGKSNVIRALMFALQRDIDRAAIYENLDASLRDTPGAPKLSIYVDLSLSDCPPCISTITGSSDALYSFRAFRNGKIERRLDRRLLDAQQTETFLACFNVTYVPPIRDLGAVEANPFRELLSNALGRTRGNESLRALEDRSRKTLKEATGKLLRSQDVLRESIGVDSIEPNVSRVDLRELHDQVSLDVIISNTRVPLSALGTGHQSLAMMHLYRQLASAGEGSNLYLFEEPDNHLHPTVIRAIGQDLRELSQTATVVASSHSPVLMNSLGYEPLVPLYKGADGYTRRRAIDLDGFSDRQIRGVLAKYGIRATEPLLASEVIVVEGISDAAILTQLHTRWYGVTPDQDNVLIIAAEGKAGVVELCSVLQAIGCDWRATVDEDACYSGQQPVLRDGVQEKAFRSAIATVEAGLNDSKRATGYRKALRSVERELSSPSAQEVYDGSEVERLIDIAGLLGAADRSRLRAQLRRGRVQVPRELLTRSRLWVWRPSIEHALVDGKSAADIVEAELISQGRLASSIGSPSDKREQVANCLHNLAGETAALAGVVDALYDSNAFARTQVTAGMKSIFVRGGRPC